MEYMRPICQNEAARDIIVAAEIFMQPKRICLDWMQWHFGTLKIYPSHWMYPKRKSLKVMPVTRGTVMIGTDEHPRHIHHIGGVLRGIVLIE
jgi:hypothetical protein